MFDYSNLTKFLSYYISSEVCGIHPVGMYGWEEARRAISNEDYHLVHKLIDYDEVRIFKHGYFQSFWH